ncbi:MAG: 50S ribosomal protein L11 methyltransferase [Firmicutes bacterium]|nr:50S ribosomal protein L11 methyltransferase [Bacillota bacterium]
MQWSEVIVTIDGEGKEAVANMFHELGAGGVVIEDPEVVHRYRSEGWEYEDLPLPEAKGKVVVRGYLAVDSSLAAKLEEVSINMDKILAALPQLEGIVEYRRVGEEDWAGGWKKHYRTIKMGQRLVIKPIWEYYEPTPHQVVIEIDPGMAFGTGTHPTTVMCLLALEEYITGGERVFDIGTGSGILAIAAAKLGAAAVTGVDRDPIAVDSARSNVIQNGVEDRVLICQGDLLKGLGQPADLIVANLTADVIMDLAAQLGPFLLPGGRAILGGIVAARSTEVQETLLRAGFVIIDSRVRDDWTMFIIKGK